MLYLGGFEKHYQFELLPLKQFLSFFDAWNHAYSITTLMSQRQIQFYMTKRPQTQFKLKKTKFLPLLPGLNESRENENYETLSKN